MREIHVQTSDEIYQGLQDRVRDTPYTVTRTDYGLLLHLQVADLRWVGLLHQHSLQKEYSIELMLREDEHIYSRQQVVRAVSWTTGVGTGGAVAQVSTKRTVLRGTVYEKELHLQFGLTDGGRPAALAYAFDSTWLSKTVNDFMADTGWRKQVDSATRTGLIVAAAGLGFALLMGIIAVLIVVLL